MAKTATAYTFDELSKDAKKKALEKTRHWTTEDYEWWDCVYQEWIEKLADMGYETEEKKMHFSGFWSQGDGASFEASVDVLKWLEATDKETEDGDDNAQSEKPEVEYRSLRYWLKKLGTEAAYVKIYHQGHYYHRFCMYIDSEWSEWIEPPKAVEQLEELTEGILGHARDQALKLYRDLEAECESRMTDEYITDYLQANEFLFWSDGTPAPNRQFA